MTNLVSQTLSSHYLSFPFLISLAQKQIITLALWSHPVRKKVIRPTTMSLSMVIRYFNLNPLSIAIWQRFPKISILIEEFNYQKISYERCAYESVDEKSLS